jgi:hypothetical protein
MLVNANAEWDDAFEEFDFAYKKPSLIKPIAPTLDSVLRIISGF